MKNTTKERKKKLHNYIILCLVLLVSVGIVLYLCKWYKIYEDYQKEIPIIRDQLQEIVSDDLEHVILENPTTILYICTSNDEECRSFEKRFIKLLRKKDYREDIIYLNVTGIDQDTFVNNFNQKYAKKKELTTKYPAFVLFEDGVATNILQEKSKELSMSKVKHFLELNKLGE